MTKPGIMEINVGDVVVCITKNHRGQIAVIAQGDDYVEVSIDELKLIRDAITKLVDANG